MRFRRFGVLLLGVFTLALFTARAPAGIVSYTDIGEWTLAASQVGTGIVRTIDFETLPDGNPSVNRTPITPEFNYTDLGVTFSSPFPELFIAGDPVSGFLLASQNPDTNARNWIIGHFAPNSFAVGIIFPGHTTLSIYDDNFHILGQMTGGGSGDAFFLGVLSDIPIAWMTQDRGASFDSMRSVLFTPVPDPGTCLLLVAGAIVLIVRPRSRSQVA